MIRALGTAAVNLERLEIAFHRDMTLAMRPQWLHGGREGGSWVAYLYMKDYSWMDPPVEVPQDPGSLSESEMRDWTEDAVRFVRGRLRANPEDVPRVEEEMRRSGDYRASIWMRLERVEILKRFFGVEVIEVLKGFRSKVLRSIDMWGTVDGKWMRAVARATGVTVRARVNEGDEWTVVRPIDVRQY